MKTVTARPSFQGDMMIRRINAMPACAKIVVASSDQHILAHSETGHHHVVDSRAAGKLIDETNAFIVYLNVITETEIKHLRNFDQHESIFLTPGLYEIRQQREYVAESFRRVED